MMFRITLVAIAMAWSAYPTPSAAFSLSPQFGMRKMGGFPQSATSLRPMKIPSCQKFHTCSKRQAVPGLRMSEVGAATLPEADISAHMEFIKDVATAPVPPDAKRLEAFAQILQSQGEDLIPPTQNKGVHPYVIPISSSETEGHVTGLLRTPDTNGEMAVVRSSPHSLTLLAPTVEKFIKRAAIEADFFESRYATEIVRVAKSNGLIIEEGAAKSSKLGLERYLLVNVGAFPDLYEWLANDWLGKGKQEEALITCSRASSLMTEWGKLHLVHSQTLQKIGGRELEARDCARACLQLPLWTAGADAAGVEELVGMAESTMEKMAASYSKWATTGGPEEDFVNEGLGPEQIALGKARYLLDTVSLLPQASWDSVREQVAGHLEEAGRLDMSKFVRGA